MIGRSASTILNAIFGWAVVALFGRTSPKQQTLLSGIVGMAAFWPLLLIGVAFPKTATFLFAFVPLSGDVPGWIFRIVWIGLAVAVPFIVGVVMASKSPPGTPTESTFKLMMRGYPITLGIACSFVFMFFSVPALQLASALRGLKDEHVPCIAGSTYDLVAQDIDGILRRNGLQVVRSKPAWWLSFPSGILRKLCGKALRGFMPEHLAYWKGTALEIAFYPSDILIRGRNQHTAWTHGLLAEALVHGTGLQTFDPTAQEVELQIRRIWMVLDENQTAHVGSKALLGRLHDVTLQLGALKVDYNDWQILYRQTMQLGRALRGEPQLLEALKPATKLAAEEKTMEPQPVRTARADALAALPTSELLQQLVSQSAALIRKEIDLARAEINDEKKREIQAAKGLGIAGICALMGVNLLLVAVVFGLAEVMPGWAAALVVAAVVLLAGAIVGLVSWAKRVQRPLEKTQKTLKEDVRWAQERLA